MRKRGIVILLLTCILLIAGCAGSEKPGNGGGYTDIEQLHGKKIGIQTGTFFDQLVQETLPDVEFLYYNTMADCLIALNSGKIDAFPEDEPAIRLAMNENDNLIMLNEGLAEFEFGFIFRKSPEGEKLQEEYNEFLTVLKQDGTLDEIEEMWLGKDESKKTVPDVGSLPAVNGTIRLATEGAYPPFNYISDNVPVGIEMDIFYRFCKEYGYSGVVDVMSFDAIIPAVQSGKYDIGSSGITITDERMESVLFSIPYFEGYTRMAVLKESASSGNIIDSIRESFEKTFIRENRYMMFLSGIWTTIYITVMAVIFGTILGFATYMWYRSGSIVAEKVTGFSVWLIQGMPIVVLLMVLYYIIFGSSSIAGEWVAVIAFTLTFASSVFGMLKSGVSAVDRGQMEAASALGFTETRAFFGVILPQAAQFFMPSYKAEIVSLIKATAIVGYVAVQDLTKMGDIVRSRTYEAFFPLIAVAVVYFVIAGIMTRIVSYLTAGIDPKKRSKQQVLKGVRTDD